MNLHVKSPEASDGISVVFTTAVAPALMREVSSVFPNRKKILSSATYNMPILIATATPNFSLPFICRFQMIFQGKRANTKSMAAEYPTAGDTRQ